MSAAAGSRVVVLGSSGGWPEPGGACSGYVVEHDGFRVVLDLGYGTLARLLARLGNVTADGLDAVVITHHHADHSIDLHGLFRARVLGGDGRLPPLPLYCPSAVLEQAAALDVRPGRVRAAFAWHPLPAAPYEVGPFRLSSFALPHYVPNAGVRLEAPGLTVAYTGDTGPHPSLVDLARDADLLIIETTEPTKSGSEQDAFYLAADEAAAVAEEAGARRVLLTHFWPGSDRSAFVSVAESIFTGQVVVAEPGATIELA